MINQGTDVLMDLGLTSCQARIYLVLCCFGALDAKSISNHSNIARHDVYRITKELEELGLIEKIIHRPNKFKAAKLKQGASILLKRKQKELNTIESKTKSLLENFTPFKKNMEIEKRPLAEFVLCPSKELLINRLMKTIEETKTSIDVSTTCKRFKFACHKLAEKLDKAWLRGVKGRVIIEKTEEPILDFVKTCWKNPYAKVKCHLYPPKTVMAIYDKKEVFIYTEPTADMMESPALWSNNPGVVNLTVDHFEILWMRALTPPC